MLFLLFVATAYCKIWEKKEKKSNKFNRRNWSVSPQKYKPPSPPLPPPLPQSILTGFYGLATWNYGWTMFLRIMLVGWAVIPKYVVGRTVSSSKYTLKVVQVNELKKLCKIECTYIAQWAPLIPNGLHWAPVTLMDLHEASLTLKWPPEISTDLNDPNWVLFSPMKPPLKLIDPHWAAVIPYLPIMTPAYPKSRPFDSKLL